MAGHGGLGGVVAGGGINGGAVQFTGLNRDTFIKESFGNVTALPFTMSCWVKTTSANNMGLVYVGTTQLTFLTNFSPVLRRMSDHSTPFSAGQPAMPVSRWSLVLRASGGDAAATRALGELMSLYWEPLYFYARRRGWTVEDSQDAVQGFYEELIRRESVQRADQARGRLRTFFLSAFENYLATQWRAGQAQKRGGGVALLSLDVAMAEGHFAAEPADTLTPERLFDRRWISTLLDRVLAALRAEYAAEGKGALFEVLQAALARDGKHFGYAEAGVPLGLSANAVKKAVFRLRTKYRERLKQEIADTLSDPADVESELLSLMAAFA